MSIFRELLSIKTFRESKAELAVRKQRSVLAEAVVRHDSAQEVLEKFISYAVSHERSLYDDLCSRIVRLRDIEDVQLAVVGLRGQEREHEDAVARADADRQAQAERLEADKKVHSEASRMKQKFVELAQVFSEESLREFERKEDAELEEAAETRRDRADWDEQTEMEAA
jgi:type III secretion protein O